MMKISVILSGCGVFDGSEIYKSTLTWLTLDQAGVEYQCLSPPGIEQMHVIYHLTGDEMNEIRNELKEVARIARGVIINLTEAKPSELSTLVVPRGFGETKNLSDYAV